MSNSDQTDQADNNNADAEGSPLTVNSRASSVDASSRPDSGVAIIPYDTNGPSSPARAMDVLLNDAIPKSGAVITPEKFKGPVMPSAVDWVQSDVHSEKSSPIRPTAITLLDATLVKNGSNTVVTKPGDMEQIAARRSR